MDASRTDSIHVKYDPMDNRVWKSAIVDGVETTRKYLVDISGQLPTIVCEIDTTDGSLKKSYIYAGAQVLAHREHTEPSDPAVYDQQFYVHDRLGSVRLVVDYNDIDATVSVANSYTYTPFGSHYDGQTPAETVENPFKFTGQWLDVEINQYYLRARMYDPTMMRFTSRDPARGKYEEPMTLHKYLYCWNNPANMVDLTGESPTSDVLPAMAFRATMGASFGSLAGFMSGVMHELVGVANGEEFDPLYVLKSMGIGAVGGAVTGGITGAWGAGVKGMTWLQMMDNSNKVLWELGLRLAGGTAIGTGLGIWDQFKGPSKIIHQSNIRQAGLLMMIEDVENGW